MVQQNLVKYCRDRSDFTLEWPQLSSFITKKKYICIYIYIYIILELKTITQTRQTENCSMNIVVVSGLN